MAPGTTTQPCASASSSTPSMSLSWCRAWTSSVSEDRLETLLHAPSFWTTAGRSLEGPRDRSGVGASGAGLTAGSHGCRSPARSRACHRTYFGTVGKDRPPVGVPGHFEASRHPDDPLHPQPGPEVTALQVGDEVLDRPSVRCPGVRRPCSRRKRSVVSWVGKYQGYREARNSSLVLKR